MDSPETKNVLWKNSLQRAVSDEGPFWGPDPLHQKPNVLGNNPGCAADWITSGKGKVQGLYQAPVSPSLNGGKSYLSIGHMASSAFLASHLYLLHPRD